MKRDDDYRMHTSYQEKGVFQNALGAVLGLGLGLLVIAVVVFGGLYLLIEALFSGL